MPRKPTGQVIETKTRDGRRFALRFRAYGKRHYLTLPIGWDAERAERELAYVTEQVQRGVWRPSEPLPTVAPAGEETFHEFASQWYFARRDEWGTKTQVDYLWRLRSYLLPFFAGHALREITVAEVDRYREAQVHAAAARRDTLASWRKLKPADRGPKPRQLSAGSINKTLILLGAILDVAEERDLIDRNPMRKNPERRKLKTMRPRPVHLDTTEHIAVLLEAASILDRATDNRRSTGRRALIATLVFSGMRLGEACKLRWRDVDLANGRLYTGSKTDAGWREIDMLPVLRDELLSHKAAAGVTLANQPVFVTRTGKRRGVDNARQRVLEPVLALAAQLLSDRDAQPLPEGVTAHKLRHTFASILTALGSDPAYVMGQLGHSDPKFTLRVYTHVMRRGQAERDQLRALVEGRDWAATGSDTPTSDSAQPVATGPATAGTPAHAGAPGEAAEGTRTLDLLHGKQPAHPETPGNQGA